MLMSPLSLLWSFDPISVENRIRVTGMELVGVMPTVQGFVRCDPGSLWLVITPVHEATTHENSTTMSLYGYGLA
jgi:hypothetical protein